MTTQLPGLSSLDQALAVRTEQLRSELKDSYSSGLGLKRSAFKELGKLLTYCPPHDYTALGDRGPGLNVSSRMHCWLLAVMQQCMGAQPSEPCRRHHRAVAHGRLLSLGGVGQAWRGCEHSSR